MTATWYEVLAEVVNRAHLAGGSELPAILDAAGSRLGISAELYLADLPQHRLHPLTTDGSPGIAIGSTVAGRAFQHVEIVAWRDRDTGRPALWVPVVDGTHRVGVLYLVLPEGGDPDDTDLRGFCWTLGGLLGYVITTKLSQSDLLHRVRRPKDLSVSAELLWEMMPPQTFATPHMTVSAIVEYYDEAGGDGYDYNADGDSGYFAVFDATGHDIQAGLVCSTALAATRNARRCGHDLATIARDADAVVRANTSHSRFATAVLARLDFATGLLTYVNAGHPPPLVLRGGRAAKLLTGGHRLPLGLQHLNRTSVATEPATERLEPGDRLLLYTDGVTEARNSRGEHFGLERLADFVIRHSAAGLPAPETLRRISHAVLDHQAGHLQDDATLMFVEWPTPSHPHLLPAESSDVLR
ncbi:PP2C family protein-serine/threonine phosphatase [Saccharomonospora piscinae]|uniref:PP2C family protein-serine/threonine phosphatase n=1 Tax=Saccharomonospora piscinae TaxID=687388 RepID=UPI000465AB70|nr:PP2C family protein-serine/threonine phosphatase [Saccharomonospora piscinae]